MISQGSLGNILLINNDHNAVDFLCLNLKSEGYAVSVIPYSTKIPLESLRNIHLIVIDSCDQATEGLQLITDIKSALTTTTGIIYCAEFDNDQILIDALDAGADDCIRKPFSLRELLARVRAIMRRRHSLRLTPQFEILRFKNLNADITRKTVTIDNEQINISNIEFAILEILMRNTGSFTSRMEIFRSVWPDGAGSNDRIVDTNISRLRRKLGEIGGNIINRSGLGYMLSE